MEIRMAEERDYFQLAEMKWLHCEEDDIDYHEKNLVGVEKDLFFAEFALQGAPLCGRQRRLMQGGKVAIFLGIISSRIFSSSWRRR